MSDLESFGPFANAFSNEGIDVPGYLTFLNFREEDPNAEIVINRVAYAIGLGDPRPWINALFAEVNWRPHLVAAMALLLQRGAVDCTSLWTAIDAGSWVTPQLVVTALFRDPQFARKVIDRIDRRCPVTAPENLDPLERHSATGPAGIEGHRGKMLASFLALCPLVPELAARVNHWREDERISALLAEDAAWDKSDEIALR